MVALNSGAIHGCVGGYAIDLVFVHHLPVSFEVSFQSPLFLTNLSFGTGYFFSGPWFGLALSKFQDSLFLSESVCWTCSYYISGLPLFSKLASRYSLFPSNSSFGSVQNADGFEKSCRTSRKRLGTLPLDWTGWVPVPSSDCRFSCKSFAIGGIGINCNSFSSAVMTPACVKKLLFRCRARCRTHIPQKPSFYKPSSRLSRIFEAKLVAISGRGALDCPPVVKAHSLIAVCTEVLPTWKVESVHDCTEEGSQACVTSATGAPCPEDATGGCQVRCN